MGYLVLVLVVAVIGSGFFTTWRDHRRDEPLRRELAEQELTFRAGLHQVKILGTGGLHGTRGAWVAFKGPTSLLVRTDGFEVVSPVTVFRLLFGMEYLFRASDAVMKVSQAPSRSPAHQRDWIVVSGTKAGRDVYIAMTATDALLERIWQVLTGIGVLAVEE